MRRLAIVSMGLAVVVLTTGCMWGIVRDTTTGAPISGAEVIYTDSQGGSATATTDVNGVYVFDSGSGPVPAVGPASFVVSAGGHETLATTRDMAYDDNPPRLWERQDFSLAATYSCIMTLLPAPGPIRAVRGVDRVPTGPDAANTASCTFGSAVSEITIRLFLQGEAVFQQTIVLAPPSPEIVFPLPDELVELVPADLEPGSYERQIEVTTVEREMFDVALVESTVWVD